jgi:hypothetical protein
VIELHPSLGDNSKSTHPRIEMSVTRLLAIALAALGAAGCSDPAGPPEGTTPITLELCSGFGALGWVAYQNDGGAWTQLSPNFAGTVSFDATPKVSIAIGFSFFGTSVTQVINATAAELSGPGVRCDDAFGARSMNGTVAGLTGDQSARITAGTSTASAFASQPGWSMQDMSSSVVDIVATRYSSFGSVPDRALVRRNVLPSNGSIPALNFASAESAALETATLTLGGIPASATAGVATSILTANGTFHDLADVAVAPSSSPTQTVDYVSVPAGLRIATDQHILTATAFTADGQVMATHYYKTPAAKTLTFGPLVSAPTLSNVMTTPYVRPRAQIAAQSAYPGAVLVQWMESTSESDSRVVGVMTTAGYAGGAPATWTVEFPDMSSANYNPSWGLQSTSYQWAVAAYSSTTAPGDLLGQQPAPDGTTVLSATRSSDGSTILTLRARQLTQRRR